MTSGEVFRISAESDCVSGIEVDGACELTARERECDQLWRMCKTCVQEKMCTSKIFEIIAN